MNVSEAWIADIERACNETCPEISNRLITDLHFRLSEAIAEIMGRDAGPNFHTWAVWGSQKAGVTIRQEDLEQAVNDATLVGGLVGGAVGLVCGVVAARKWMREFTPAQALVGAVIGTFAGRLSGKRLAKWSRKKAAELILEGNQAVLRDIGTQSARFLKLLETGASPEQRAAFFLGLTKGPTEAGGQDRLATAFRSYLVAFDCRDSEARKEAMIAGNCEIVFHEHIRLDPYIRESMPVIVRRCATKRLMAYDIGRASFSVGEDIPGSEANCAAGDWTRLEERMRYVFSLFRRFHESPEVFAEPTVANITNAAVEAQTGIRSLRGKVRWER